MWRSGTTLVMAACWLGAWGVAARADEPREFVERGSVLEVTEENDWFAGTDRHYTQGARMVYLGAEHSQPHWLKDFAAWGLRVDAWRSGFQFGQLFFTPENLLARERLPNDVPYSGWLYAGPILQRRGVMTSLGVPVLETFQLQAGIIGPGALGEEVQNTAHFFGSSETAQGWSNQLHDEPGLAAKYQRTWRVAPSGPHDWSAEVLPHLGGSVGNVDTSLRGGVTLRVGWRIPDDFGVWTIDGTGVADGGHSVAVQNNRHGAYAFIRAEERYVGYNEFLNGNLFYNSQRVTIRRDVGDLQGGFVLVTPRLDLAFTMDFRTRDFFGQDNADLFGSISLRMKF